MEDTSPMWLTLPADAWAAIALHLPAVEALALLQACRTLLGTLRAASEVWLALEQELRTEHVMHDGSLDQPENESALHRLHRLRGGALCFQVPELHGSHIQYGLPVFSDGGRTLRTLKTDSHMVDIPLPRLAANERLEFVLYMPSDAMLDVDGWPQRAFHNLVLRSSTVGATCAERAGASPDRCQGFLDHLLERGVNINDCRPSYGKYLLTLRGVSTRGRDGQLEAVGTRPSRRHGAHRLELSIELFGRWEGHRPGSVNSPRLWMGESSHARLSIRGDRPPVLGIFLFARGEMRIRPATPADLLKAFRRREKRFAREEQGRPF